MLGMGQHPVVKHLYGHIQKNGNAGCVDIRHIVVKAGHATTRGNDQTAAGSNRSQHAPFGFPKVIFSRLRENIGNRPAFFPHNQPIGVHKTVMKRIRNALPQRALPRRRHTDQIDIFQG